MRLVGGEGPKSLGTGVGDAENGCLEQLARTWATWLPQRGAGVRSSQRQAVEQEWASILETPYPTP